MSSIYGIFGGSHDASTSLIVDGKIVNCVEEERITRIKAGNNYHSVPNLSLKTIESTSGISLQEADHFVASALPPSKFIETLNKSVEVYDHHHCHAAGTYYTSGMSGKVLIITMDGGGVDNAFTIYLAEDGEMNRVHSDKWSSSGQISQVWGYSLHGIHGANENGEFIWKMCKDEGKLMGMAPDGVFDEQIYKFLKQLVDYNNLEFYPIDTMGRTRFVAEQMRRNGWFDTPQKIANFANTLQHYTEELFLKFLSDVHKRYPQYSKIALAGGLFANVKLNQKINQLDWVDEIYVYPAMGDNGLSLGAAILKCRELGEGFQTPQSFDNVYFGLKYTNGQIYDMSKKWALQTKPYIPSQIGKSLNEGQIIGWFRDGFEYGPRALGARSILVRPTDVSTHKELNERLKRYDTMPFAPMVLADYFDDIFVETKSKYTAEFMTLCYDTKDEWVDKIPAVIQKSDKTARPQIVRKDKLPKVWEVINEYYKLSGIPVVLNTSFNAHNEPIINSPDEAFIHLKNGIIDQLVIEDYVYFR